jgi:hypothetical protein
MLLRSASAGVPRPPIPLRFQPMHLFVHEFATEWKSNHCSSISNYLIRGGGK